MIFFRNHELLRRERERADRAEARFDALMERLASPIALTPPPQAAERPGLQEKTYISDEPYHDASWNEHKGIETEDEV